MKLDPHLLLPLDVKARMVKAWLTAEKLPGNDLGLWRRDVEGNPIFYPAYKVNRSESRFAWTTVGCFRCYRPLAVKRPVADDAVKLCPMCKSFRDLLVKRLSLN